MKVSSPVGDYPYEVRRVDFRRGRLIIYGSLGVWETTFEVEPGDWLALGRRLALPLAAAGALALLRMRRTGG